MYNQINVLLISEIWENIALIKDKHDHTHAIVGSLEFIKVKRKSPILPSFRSMYVLK